MRRQRCGHDNIAQFPVMMGRHVAGPVVHVPWNVGEEAWEKYRAKYGNDQSCKRIAERGGFWESEMDNFRPGWREFILCPLEDERGVR